jgi:hypothetical protein
VNYVIKRREKMTGENDPSQSKNHFFHRLDLPYVKSIGIEIPELRFQLSREITCAIKNRMPILRNDLHLCHILLGLQANSLFILRAVLSTNDKLLKAVIE